MVKVYLASLILLIPSKDTNPLWIDVTNHSPTIERIPDAQQEFFYKKNIRRKSPGTIAICGAINFKYNIPAVPHLAMAFRGKKLKMG